MAEQLAAVEALPPARPSREALLEFGLAVARLVVTRARPLFDPLGLEWPGPLARAARRRVADCLGVDPDWLVDA